MNNSKLLPPQEGSNVKLPVDVLFEDNHIIIVNKKSGEIVQGDKTGDEPLSERVKKYIKEKYQKPGEVFLGTVHRIDRPVSGIVIFARTSKALERLNEMFRNKQLKKTYWAVVKNKPAKPADHLTAYLKKNEAKNKSFVQQQPSQGALLSELEYELLAASDKYFLLKINPITGRHHQIRAMLAHIGSPIKGDLKYGFDRSNPDGSIHLHAREVAFVHPVNKENINIVCPPPEEPLWNFFKEKMEKE
ncbi:MAG TPA: RluA family pseudouridine synthase [Bacteroidia bacterium]|nr:RluA family pseudouridine synthase [Bacteroidia bacterium]